jgi:5-deoxy-D-glucuronate isomerase
MLEETYLFVDMPEPAFGVQFVYTDPRGLSWSRWCEAIVLMPQAIIQTWPRPARLISSG